MSHRMPNIDYASAYARSDMKILAREIIRQEGICTIHKMQSDQF